MRIDKNRRQVTTAELRRRAEEQLEAKAPETGVSPTEYEMQRLLHELQVHQIELEMQNAELCQSRDEVETALEKYTDLYDFAPVGYVTLDHDGAVRAVNLTCAGLLRIERSRLLGRHFEQLVAPDDRPVFSAYLRKAAGSRIKETCEVALLKEGRHPFCVQIKAVSAASGQECRLALIDISEQKELREELAAKVAQLEAALVKS
jgi:PAS domain S-box-containing protein